MLVEPDAGAGLGHDIRERGLADLKRIAPQIVAVQVACFVMPGALPFPEPVPLWEPETYSATASRNQSVFRGVASVCRNGIAMPASLKASRMANRRSVPVLPRSLRASTNAESLKLRVSAPKSKSTEGAGVVVTSGLAWAILRRVALTLRGSQPYVTLAGITMRRMLSRRVQFFTFSVMKQEFGMRTRARSEVSISVERTLILRTWPSSPPTTTKSPTLIGRSARRIRPDTKLLTTLCRPKPIPTENARARMARLERLKPA